VNVFVLKTLCVISIGKSGLISNMKSVEFLIMLVRHKKVDISILK